MREVRDHLVKEKGARESSSPWGKNGSSDGSTTSVNGRPRGRRGGVATRRGGGAEAWGWGWGGGSMAVGTGRWAPATAWGGTGREGAGHSTDGGVNPI
jgi:hypothetical protein